MKGNGINRGATTSDNAAALAALTKLEQDIVEVIRDVREALAIQPPESNDRQKRSLASAMRYYKNPNTLLKKLSS